MTNPPSRGFTLLEVLIALVIFAVASIMCYRQVDESFRSSTRIEQRYLALWIAENQLEDLFITREWPTSGETQSEVEMNSTRWAVKTKISESEIKNLRKIEVAVYADDKKFDSPVLTLTRFIGKN